MEPLAERIPTGITKRHNLTHKVTTFQPKIGDVVIVKTESKNRVAPGRWPQRGKSILEKTASSAQCN